MSVTIQVRRDLAANWTSVNPVLNQGEIGLETDTGKAKIGDGVTHWASLAYWNPGGDFTNPMTLLGDLISGGASGAAGRLAGNTTATKEFLTSTGTGSAANAPAWGALASGDIPNNAANTSGTAGGLSATLAIGSGGTGQTTQQAALDALAGAVTSGQVLRGNGTHVLLAALQAGDVPDLSATYATLATAQTIAGAKTFSLPPALATQSVSATATLNAASAPVVLTDTTTAAFTLTLPAAPVTGEWFVIIDDTGQWNTHNLTIGRNAKNIDGAASNLTLQNQWGKVWLYYDGTAWWSLANGLSNETPAALGSASPGTHNSPSRANHVHPLTGITRSSTLVVAASTASAADKAAADYVCTGTADDVQINAAFAALPSLGGLVYLTEGVFYLSSPLVPVVSSTVLKGAGISATQVDLAPGANCNGYQYLSSTGSLIFCSIQSLTFVGNKATNTSGYGVQINPSGGQTFWDFHLRDVFITGWPNDGFYSYDGHGYVLDHVIVEGSNGWGINFPVGGTEPEIRNGTIKNNGAGGIQVSGSGSVVAENEVGNNTGYGISIIGSGVVRDNTVYFNTGSGINAGSTAVLGGARVCGNTVYNNSQHGIVATQPGATITENWLYSNSQGTANTYDEIQVQKGLTTVTDNFINGNSNSRYGVNFTGNFTGNVYSGNQVQNQVSGNYNFAFSGVGLLTAYRQASASVTPSATSGTYGTVVNLSPETGYNGFFPVTVFWSSSGVGAETLTLETVITYNDGTSSTQAILTITTNGTSAFSPTNIFNMMTGADGRIPKQLGFALKSTINSSTGAVVATVVGINLP